MTAAQSDDTRVFGDVDFSAVRALLIDADGNLFPSEEPAFAASAEVVNQLMAALGAEQRYEAEQLRLATTGKNFRTTAADLAAAAGRTLAPADLDRWVLEEKHAVTDHLRTALAEDPEVTAVLGRLAARYELAVVSSSALTRLDACFTSTGLARLLPEDRRFSAEDSLERPTSKPDPAIYAHAVDQLEITPAEGLAIEDSATGAASAVAAGLATVGNVCYVAPEEREARIAELCEAGVCAVVSSWSAFERLLG